MAIVLTARIDRDDARVAQRGGGACLTEEPVERCLVADLPTNDFDGDPFDEIPGATLFRFIDDAHAALKDFADDVVTKFVLNGEQRHVAMLLKVNGKSSFAANFDSK